MQRTLFLDPQKTMFLVSAVNSLPNGKSTLSDPSGNVYSLQPTRDWPAPDQPLFQDRPAGAAGGFEQCDVAGQTATFWYVWKPDSETPKQLVGPVTVAFAQVTSPAGS